MKEMILEYLDTNYTLKLSSYSSYFLEEKQTEVKCGLRDVIQDLTEIFDGNKREVNTIFDEWSDTKISLINDRIIEIRQMIFEKTGFKLELTPHDLNMLMG